MRLLRVPVACLLLIVALVPSEAAQAVFTARELASYQLTEAAFEKFAHATRLMIATTRIETRFADAPLFNRDTLVAGDAPQMATALTMRLDTDPSLASALFAADLSARDYATFALTLFAARLAHGFMKSGVLRAVPAGVAEHNVAFVATHEARIVRLLRALGVED